MTLGRATGKEDEMEKARLDDGVSDHAGAEGRRRYVAYLARRIVEIVGGGKEKGRPRGKRVCRSELGGRREKSWRRVWGERERRERREEIVVGWEEMVISFKCGRWIVLWEMEEQEEERGVVMFSRRT